jgi:probable phosphoglycerate mutase
MPDASYWQIRQDLCNLSSFEADPASGVFSLACLNDACHLDRALPRAEGEGTRVILIRHGQTAWNLGAGVERFRGRTDLPLDDTGQAQARSVAERLRLEPIDALYSSPLLRARQTMAPLADALGLPVQTHPGLLDMDYGDWQGLTHAEAAAAFPEPYAAWRSHPSQVHFPGGECLAELEARLRGLLEEVANRHPAQTVALVGHQMVNKVAACTLLGLNLDQVWRVRQDPCGLDVFQHVNGGWHTLCLNDTCHLVNAGGTRGKAS